MIHQIGQFGLRTRFVLCVVFVVSMAAGIGVPVSAADIILVPNDPVQGSIQGAIFNASSGDTIVLNPGIYYENYIWLSKDITIKADTISGGDRTNTIIDGMRGLNGIFTDYQNTGASITIDNLTLRNGWSSGSGGAIYSTGNVTIISSTITDCLAVVKGGAGSGGAIFSAGSVTVISSSIINCSAQGTIVSTPYGGAIHSDGDVIVTSSAFNNCSAHMGGGAFFAQGNATVTDSVFSRCMSYPLGGAIWVFSGNVMVTGSTFKDCSTNYGGGAIYVTSGNVTVSSSTFSNCFTPNSGASNGGAINAKSGSVTVTDSTFINCTVDYSSGGAIFSGSNITVISSTFTNCTATGAGQGGAVYSANDITVTSSSFTDCSAGSSGTGGAILSGSGNATITNSTFFNCSAGVNGGAVRGYYNVIITSSTFINCSSSIGGAIHSLGSVMVRESTITNSSAVDVGYGSQGGAICASGEVTIINSSLANCSATNPSGSSHANTGGAIYTTGNVTVTESNITDCSAASNGGSIWVQLGDVTVTDSTISNCSSGGSGGAISNTAWQNLASGNLTVTDSTISDCSASLDGGAIMWYASATVTNSTISNCSSSANGGAISISPDWYGTGTATVTDSTFTNCSANSGGAIYPDTGSTIKMTSSSISDCSAINGGAIYTFYSTAAIQFSRIYNNTGIAVYNTGGTVDAANNWWGSNSSPSAQVSSGVSYSPWLVLGATATPALITTADTSTVQANLTYDSEGNYHDPALGHVPDAIPVTYIVASGPGSVSPALAATINGLSQITFTPTTAGTATVTATIDGQTVSAIIEISGGAPPTVLPGLISPPTDPDGDGIYEDLNGNNRLDFADVVLYFNQMTWIAANEPVSAFDLNKNGRIDFADIVALFNEI